MKIRRIHALELMGALRTLDNYTFKPEVVEKMVANLVVLRKLSEEIGVHREELAGVLGVKNTNDMKDPKYPEFDKKFGDFLSGEVEVPLITIPAADWDFGTNRLPITIRERILPIVGPCVCVCDPPPETKA